MTRHSLLSRVAVQALVTVGGAAALSWESLWQLESALALGVSARAAAIVLAATMAGMALGAFAAGRALRGRDRVRPLPLYGLCEGVIGLSGLAMLPAFALLERLDVAVYAIAPALAPFAHAVGIALLLGPPTLAMGATVPLFELMARQFGTRVSVLYGLNTAGASVGVLGMALGLLPSLGVRETALAVAGGNLGIFATATLLGRRAAIETGSAAPAEGRRSGLAPGAASVLVFGTGFATFALEVAWFRSLRAAFHSTTDTFAILLASVLIPLAVGARAVPWLRRRGASLGAILVLSAVAVLLTTPLVERMDLLAPLRFFWPDVALRLAASLATLGPPILLLGIALPWTLEEFREPAGIGRLYAANTAGAVCGALAAAWLLLPGIGFAATVWGIGLGIFGLSLLPGRRGPWSAAIVAGALAVAVTQSAALGRERVQGAFGVGPYRIVAYREAPDSTVSVVESASGRRHLLVDGFQASSELSAGSYMEWMGHLPMLLHPDPKDALVICFGTGRTTDAVRREGPERLDVVDVSQAVLDLAPLFPANGAVLEDPRVRAIVMDGRAWLRRTERRYDVVTLEPMPPNFAGTNALYSREFYEAVAARLKPGGVVAQWLPLHLLEPRDAEAVSATFREAFPDALLWIAPEHPTIGILLGRREGAGPALGSEWPGLARDGVERPGGAEEIRRAVALDPAALARYAEAAPIISDDNQLLAYGRPERPYRRRNWARRNIQFIAAAGGAYPYIIPARRLEFEMRPQGEP